MIWEDWEKIYKPSPRGMVICFLSGSDPKIRERKALLGRYGLYFDIIDIVWVDCDKETRLVELFKVTKIPSIAAVWDRKHHFTEPGFNHDLILKYGTMVDKAKRKEELKNQRERDELVERDRREKAIRREIEEAKKKEAFHNKKILEADGKGRAGADQKRKEWCDERRKNQTQIVEWTDVRIKKLLDAQKRQQGRIKEARELAEKITRQSAERARAAQIAARGISEQVVRPKTNTVVSPIRSPHMLFK